MFIVLLTAFTEEKDIDPDYEEIHLEDSTTDRYSPQIAQVDYTGIPYMSRE
jgi:hypothetical protein